MPTPLGTFFIEHFNVNDHQAKAIQYAIADLIHAYKAPSHSDIDWESIRYTILRLAEAFPALSKVFNKQIETLEESNDD